MIVRCDSWATAHPRKESNTSHVFLRWYCTLPAIEEQPFHGAPNSAQIQTLVVVRGVGLVNHSGFDGPNPRVCPSDHWIRDQFRRHRFRVNVASEPSSDRMCVTPIISRTIHWETPSTLRTRRGGTRPTRSRRPIRPHPPATGRVARTAMLTHAALLHFLVDVRERFPLLRIRYANYSVEDRCRSFANTVGGCAGRSTGASTASGPCSAQRTGSVRPRSTTRAPVATSRSSG